MAKPEKLRYVLNLKLETQKWQEDVLNIRFDIGRQIYNKVLGVSQKRYNEMIKTKAYRENEAQLKILHKRIFSDPNIVKTYKNKLKPLYSIKKELLKKYQLTEFSFHNDVKYMQHHYKMHIDSLTAQAIASRVWKAYDKLLFSDGEEVHFKPFFKGLNSLEGKNNTSGLKYNAKSSTLIWNGLNIPVQLSINNKYETDALRSKICYCRVKRKFIRGKYKYILQLVLEGIQPIKESAQLGKSRCGLDIGTQTIAKVNEIDIKLLELAPDVQNIENEKRRILRYMDRSKKATNPDNFNPNGTIKRRAKLTWNFSKKYIKARYKLKDLYRKQADIRELNHNIMANSIIRECNVAFVEDMNFKALQKRVKKTEISEKTGRYKRKKRFGKSLANKAPAKFLLILSNKLKARGSALIKINTREVKASQYNHLDQQCTKKKLSQRMNYFNYHNEDIKVQRDIYSAYIIKNVNDDLCTVNNDQCVTDFDSFLKLHHIEIDRLSLKTNLSSMSV